MKTNKFRRFLEFTSDRNRIAGTHAIRTIILAITFILGNTQVQLAQDEFPKQSGLHAQQGIDIIPEPQLAVITGGDFVINSATVVYTDLGLKDLSSVTSLQEGLLELFQIQVINAISQPSRNGISLKLVSETSLRDIPAGNAKKEGYSLEVTPSQIIIKAAYPAGLFYGVQTLLQLTEQGQGHVRGLRITDWPEMEFRAIHVDLWYHLDRPWYYEYLFKQLASYKINTAVFEFEDKFPFSKHPVLSAPCAMTPEQVRQMVQMAKRYYIEIVPLAQTLGHAAFIAKHEEFSDLRELPVSNYELCPLKKGSLALIQDMLEEQLELIKPAKYVHIGGDEAYELGKGTECREKWGDNAVVESYKLWLNFVCDYLKKQGKTAIVWDDMFLKYFSQADMANLPDNLIYMRWQYGNGKIEAKNRKILDLGYPVWIATAAQTMTPVYPDQKLRVFNNANLLPASAALGIKGMLNTAWEDPGTHPETYWIGFVCSAEYSWSSKKPATDEFMNKFFTLFYGRNQQELDKVYSVLSEKGFIRAESSWTREFAALDLPPLPDNEFQVDTTWARKNSKLVAQAKEMRPRYAQALEIVTKNLAGDTKNKYNLEVLLLCNQTLLHFTDVILSISEINDNLLSAYADHQKGADPSALNRYQKIGRIIEDLRYDKSRLFDETVRIWEKSMYPKDCGNIPGGREKFVHQIDLSNYYGNKTMDLNYIFEIEEQIGLFSYQQKLYRVMQNILRNYRQ
jgi:hexosaminidase